ncbi:MAG: hypothetical protein EOM26_14030 [Alphaproteobacteria bacterium]|nr:hypothetical protein [Alphaproteobacteria bacterium]
MSTLDCSVLVRQHGHTVLSMPHVENVNHAIAEQDDRLQPDDPYEVFVFDAEHGQLIDHYHAAKAQGRS